LGEHEIEITRFLPKQLAMGLSEQPYYVDVQTQAPESLLPAIDMEESEPGTLHHNVL